METTWLLIALFPLIGALIGWLTNRVAIKMLFRPREPRRILGIRFQGLIPRQHEEIAARTAEIVAEEIIQKHVLREELQQLPIQSGIESLVDRMIYSHLIPRLREIPLVGGFLNDRAILSLRRQALEAVQKEMPSLLDQVGKMAEEKIDIRKIVESKILAFDLETLEEVVQKLAQREFRKIEVLGAVLGGFVGLIQAGLVFLAGI